MPAEPEVFELWPENEESLTVFLSCATQWDLSHQGRAQRLNYPALFGLMEVFEIKDRRQMFRDMQAMESAALAEFNKG
jgi:hypothetical protein